jgi:hypothetical protein
MEIQNTAEIYEISINDNGDYIDNPKFYKDKPIRCPCNNKIFNNKNTFKKHFETGVHKTWLCQVNLNKRNYYILYLKNEELIKNQQKILIEYENVISQQKILIKNYEENVLQLKNTFCNIQLLQNKTNQDIDLMNFENIN